MSSDRNITIFICSAAILFGVIFKALPLFYYKQGSSYFKNRDYVKAYHSLKKAYNLDKHNKDYRYYFVQILSNLSPTLTVQREMFEIASSKEKDSAQYAAEEKISQWRNNVLRNIGDNYIEQAPLDRGILRWDEKKFPLKIQIIDESGAKLPAYYFAEIDRSFAQWQASVDFITFEKVTQGADIIVKITPLPADVCEGSSCRYVVGFTTPDYSGSLLKKMTIVLYAKDPLGNFFSDKELYNTILHETGHALGIMGHSYSSEDLMYMSAENNNSFYAPYRSSFQYLSSKDINTIKLLYKLIPTVTNTPLDKFDISGLVYAPIILGTSEQISSRKIKEAQNYIKKAPDLAGGYIDLGIAYAELNKTGEAIKAMKKAQQLAKSNNEKYMVLYNLAVIYLESKTYNKALECAKEAQNISQTEEIKELIMNIKHAETIKK